MKNLTVKAYEAVLQQKHIAVPVFAKGTTADQKKTAMQKLIDGAEKPAQTGKQFGGEK